MIREAFYDPHKSYYENYEHGPFGAFADDEVYECTTNTAHELYGHTIHAPFGIPAGPLLNAAYVTAALDKGFDLPMYKTVRSGMHESHQYPNVVPVNITGDLTLEQADAGLVSKNEYTDPLSITNSFGVPSYDPDVWQADVACAVAHAQPGQLVGLSFQGTKSAEGTVESYLVDWVTTAKLAAQTGAGYLEANLSCPNEGTANLLCFDVDRVREIAERIKSAIGDIPLWLKISYFRNPTQLEQLVDRVGHTVQGFATINTISAEVRTQSGEQALPGEGRLRSGVCGHTIKWAGVEMVERLVALREDKKLSYHVIGVGGVTTPQDYHEYRNAGADVVMSATGAMWNPFLAKEIKETL